MESTDRSVRVSVSPDVDEIPRTDEDVKEVENGHEDDDLFNGRTQSIGTIIKKNAFDQKFPPKTPEADKRGMRHAVSDNHLAQKADEWKANQMKLLLKKRGSMTEMASMTVDHTVWIDTPMFATVGVQSNADTFYRNAKHQSLAQMHRGETPDNNLQVVIDYYEQGSAMTSTLFINVVQGLMHSVMFGWSIGVLNVPQNDIEKEFGIADSDFLWLNAVFALGCIPGSFMGGYLSDRWGRKKFLIFNDVIWIICAIVFYFAINFYAYIVMRFVIGLAAGGASVVVPTFLGEISPVRIRGAIGTCIQLSLTMGILIPQFISKPGWVNWKIVVAMNSALAVVQLFTTWTFMESPAWLMMQDRDDEAERTLQKLRHRRDVEFEMRILESGVEKREGPKTSVNHTSLNGSQSGFNDSPGQHSKPLLAFADKAKAEPTFRDKVRQRIELKKALTIAVILLINQQFSGINSVFFYSSSLFDQANVDPWLGTVLASSANVVGVVLALSLVENLGRKACLISSGFIMIAASACSIIGLDMNENNSTSFWQWFTIGASMLYVIGFELGFGPIPWTIAAELTPSSELSTVQGIASAANGLANFVIAVSFPHMQKAMDAYVYTPFIAVIIFTIGFVWVYVPETKGLRVEQVCQILKGTATEKEIREQEERTTEEKNRSMDFLT